MASPSTSSPPQANHTEFPAVHTYTDLENILTASLSGLWSTWSLDPAWTAGTGNASVEDFGAGLQPFTASPDRGYSRVEAGCLGRAWPLSWLSLRCLRAGCQCCVPLMTSLFHHLEHIKLYTSSLP